METGKRQSNTKPDWSFPDEQNQLIWWSSEKIKQIVLSFTFSLSCSLDILVFLYRDIAMHSLLTSQIQQLFGFSYFRWP